MNEFTEETGADWPNLPDIANGDGPHVVGHETCRACGFECVGVVPVGADLTNLECGKCGQMTSEMPPPEAA